VSIVPSTVIDFVANKNGNQSATDDYSDEATERYLTICFLQCVNHIYSPYLEHLRNGFWTDKKFTQQPCIKPSMFFNVHQCLFHNLHYRAATAWLSRKNQSMYVLPVSKCGQRTLYTNERTTRNEQQVQGSNSLVVAVECHLFSQPASNIPATWILLDNQSLMDLFSNRILRSGQLLLL
jgi:hypothetical protein